MATLIQAVTAYRPRLAAPRRMGLDELAGRLTRGSLVTESIARMVLSDLSDEVRLGVRSGASVQLPGIGTFRPAIRLDGSMHTVVRIDKALRTNLATVDDYLGPIHGREFVGLDAAALKALWDAEHPDDPVELAAMARERAGWDSDPSES